MHPPLFICTLLCRILEAADSLGLPRREDIHDPTVPPYSCGLIDVTVDENGQRHSTFDAFMNPDIMASRHRNLFVCTNVTVSRLDIREEAGGLHAVGVFLQNAQKGRSSDSSQDFYVSAKEEVIMCAGAVVTPQILMLRWASCLSLCRPLFEDWCVQWDRTSRAPRIDEN